MAYHSDPEHHKRKRHDDDHGGKPRPDRIPQPPPPQLGKHVPINYLSKASAVKLRLIQGDGDTFSDVLALINEYEGVLSRHESLASNLGAKLTGPRLLKGMEGVFDGPIVTTPSQSMFTPDPITWLDIVEFARTTPSEFTLAATPSGSRSCQFSLKGVQVEISEDDWRLIVSGSLDRFRLVPSQPLEEDETAELATLDILEQRMQVLIKKADEVARRARQLNYHLSGRKAALTQRRSPRPASPGPGFQAANQPSRLNGPNPAYDLHADLLQQFLTQNQTPPTNQRSSVGSVPPTPGTQTAGSSTPRMAAQQQIFTSTSNRPSPTYHPEPLPKEADEEHRALVVAKVEKLGRGDAIYPPCDRCRRLRTDCIKHLTACQGCTKKHAKCVWRGITEDEVAWLKKEVGDLVEEGGEYSSSREPGPGSHSAPSSQHEHQGEPRPESDAGEDVGARPMVSRIAVGRSADDVWRKVSGLGGHRPDSMDTDIVDLRDAQGVLRTAADPQHRPDSARPRDPVIPSPMATMATAATDAASTHKESPRRS